MSTLLLAFKPHELSVDEYAQVKALVPNMKILHTHDQNVIESNLEDIEIAVRDFPRHLISKAPNLRWFHQWPAGADWLMEHPSVVNKPFVLTNTSGIHADCICDHVFALILVIARKIHQTILAQQRSEWLNQWAPEKQIFEAAQKTILVVGTGSIGSRIAEVAKAFKMRVLGVRAHPERKIDGIDVMFGPDELHHALPQADFVVIAAPLTHKTAGMFGEAEFKAMKSSAYLINIGRGGILREDELVLSLKNGEIAGAGLDAFVTEPLPRESPLWSLENVLITPHYAGNTPHYHQKAMKIFFDNLDLYARGLPLQNVVDKAAGY